MASFKSILGDIGHVLAKVFNPAVITSAATVADIVFPQFSVLINATTQAIIAAENAAIVAGKQEGSGEQKAAMVIAAIEQHYQAFAAANNVPVIPENVRKYVDAVVAALNSFPASAA